MSININLKLISPQRSGEGEKMRIVLLSVLVVLLVFMVAWFGWGIYDRCYLNVPAHSVVFRMDLENYPRAHLTQGGHWVWDKSVYQVEYLPSILSSEEVNKLIEIADKDGWYNFCNWQFTFLESKK